MTNPNIQQGIGALKSGGLIGGITVSEYAGSPETYVVGNRNGDICIDYTNGALYVFVGTAGAKTAWKLVTQAS